MTIKDFCRKVYSDTFQRVMGDYPKKNPKAKGEETERVAQLEAIKECALSGMREFPTTEPSEIWKTIYEIHVHHKSGIDDAKTIDSVISANQSWIKSSGHAFEAMIKVLGNLSLNKHGIEIVLQRDLNTIIKAKELANEPRDISWLKEQIDGNIFDLYALTESPKGKCCFGCIQSKTSIRDRVTRDREPSIHAMESYFWSVALVLDGDFLKNGKFQSMVNGGTHEHPSNGWHGMYVFSNKYSNDRIYATDFELKNFKDHAIKAADMWLHQRQWLVDTWRA